MALYELDGRRPLVPASAWIAPSAELIGDVRLGEGASVWFGAVIRADNTPIIIGAGSNVQDGAVLHSDPGSPCKVGNGVTIGHRAILHGCTIADDCLIGMGTTIMNDVVVLGGCVVGANALLTEGKVFERRSLIVGTPAKVIRPTDDKELERIRASATIYRVKAGVYGGGLARLDG